MGSDPKINSNTLPTSNVMRQRWNRRSLFRLIWPLMVEQTLVVTIGMVDTVMMSAVGEHAVSGVSLVDAIATLLIIAFGALATGGSVVISQYIGRRDDKNAALASRQLIYTSILAALVVMIFTLVFRTWLLRLLYGNIAPDVMQAADTYFWISALGYPFLSLYNAGAALYRSIGNSRITMLVAALVNVIHIGLNILFIYGFHMGVAGAALSTLICRTISAIILTSLLIRMRRGPIGLSGLLKVRLMPRMIRSILNVGIPSCIENSMFQFGKIVVSRIATTFGTAAIAANAVTGNINSFASMPAQGLGIALLTIVGQCVGAREYHNARYFTKRFISASIIILGAGCVVTFVFIDPLLGIYKLSPEAHGMAKQFTYLLCVASPVFWTLSFSLPNALRAAGDARFCMIVAVISMWTVRVIGAYVICYGLRMGVIGIWIAMMIDWTIRSISFTWRWFSGRWQSMKVLSDE